MAKKIAVILMLLVLIAPGAAVGTSSVGHLVIRTDSGATTISRHIYGHFAEHLGHCIYGGFWVGEDSDIPNKNGIRTDVVKALRALDIPNLRWPGGCFADRYHWREGIGPPSERPASVNTHWGGVMESNRFGTHEFMELCEQLGCEAYITGNVGSGTVEEMADWVEYLTAGGESEMAQLRRMHGRDEPWRVPWWGFGNESWSCGGHMTADYYASLLRRFSTFVQNFSGNRLYRIATGPYGDNYRWTETLMQSDVTRRLMDGIALHYYTLPRGWDDMIPATDFTEEEWFLTFQEALKIEEYILEHIRIMDQYDPEREIGLIVDEWGVWHKVEPGTNRRFLYQQNSLLDAVAAAVHLNIFNNHADRVKMANIAQTVNVLQAMLLTDGPRMVRTPTYHIFQMYKVHHDATLLPTDLETGTYRFGEKTIPAVNVSASRDDAGNIHLSLVNIRHDSSVAIQCELRGLDAVGEVTGRILTAAEGTAHNTFAEPNRVLPETFEDFHPGVGRLEVNLPARSVVILSIAG